LQFFPDIDPAALAGWLVIGAAAGWLASRMVRDGLGPIGHMVIGIIGACIGGYVLPHYGVLPPELPGDLIGGAIGAIIVLALNAIISSAFNST
jgi:uncharacterized membrane protein YeaQ/YmgE (transglycosylase-associated protein family)